MAIACFAKDTENLGAKSYDARGEKCNWVSREQDAIEHSKVMGILVLNSDQPKKVVFVFGFFSQYNKDGPYQERPLLVPYHCKSESPPLTCL